MTQNANIYRWEYYLRMAREMGIGIFSTSYRLCVSLY